jgi:hypothetical protein
VFKVDNSKSIKVSLFKCLVWSKIYKSIIRHPSFFCSMLQFVNLFYSAKRKQDLSLILSIILTIQFPFMFTYANQLFRTVKGVLLELLQRKKIYQNGILIKIIKSNMYANVKHIIQLDKLITLIKLICMILLNCLYLPKFIGPCNLKTSSIFLVFSHYNRLKLLQWE